MYVRIIYIYICTYVPWYVFLYTFVSVTRVVRVYLHIMVTSLNPSHTISRHCDLPTDTLPIPRFCYGNSERGSIFQRVSSDLDEKFCWHPHLAFLSSVFFTSVFRSTWPPTGKGSTRFRELAAQSVYVSSRNPAIGRCRL